MIILESLLRAFGAFWILGGVLTIKQAYMASFIDQALESLTLEKEDKLVTYFLFIGGTLTFLTGLGLALLSLWVFLPLALLIGSQMIYFTLQHQRFIKAKTDEQREDATVQPSTRNAFSVSLGVAIAALIALGFGILK